MDGVLVITGAGILVASIIAGAPVAVGLAIGIAAYGVADYFFDLSEMWDSNLGRNSNIGGDWEIWDY